MKVKVICSKCKTVKYADVASLKEAKAFKRMYKASTFECTECSGSVADLKLGVFTPKGIRRGVRSVRKPLYPWQPSPANLAELIYGTRNEETEQKMKKLREDFFKSMPKLRTFFNEVRNFGIPYEHVEI